MYIGFRAPLVPTAGRTKAVIAPIQNFETWFNSGPAGNPTFGSPIELNLGGRGIRDMIRLSNGIYIILAGNYDNLPLNGAVYRWTGNPADAPVELPSFGITNRNAEAAIQINDAGNISLNKLQIITDNGSDDLYNDGTEAKDLAQSNYKKFGSEVIISPITGVLPIGFEYFTASLQNGNALLNWKMGVLENVQSFSIERSFNGTDFNSINNLMAITNQQTYSYVDNNVAKENVYYRIKATLNNGQTKYSVIRYLHGSDVYVVKAYPNPVTNNVFTLSAATAGLKKVTIYTAEGKIIAQLQFTSMTKDIETAGWAKGVYFIKITNDDGSVNTTRIGVQ
jgi:hypothetical protein